MDTPEEPDLSERDKLIVELSKLLAGLQVPLSLAGPQMLGQGYEPLHAILRILPGWGWQEPEHFESQLRQILG